jgi:hypothetical protein
MIQDRPCNTRGRGATLRRFRNNQFPGGLWKRCISASIAERLAFAGLDALYLVTDDQLDARRRLGISEADPDVARVQRGPGTVTVVGLAGPHATDVLYRSGPTRLGRFDTIVVDTPPVKKGGCLPGVLLLAPFDGDDASANLIRMLRATPANTEIVLVRIDRVSKAEWAHDAAIIGDASNRPEPLSYLPDPLPRTAEVRDALNRGRSVWTLPRRGATLASCAAWSRWPGSRGAGSSPGPRCRRSRPWRRPPHTSTAGTTVLDPARARAEADAAERRGAGTLWAEGAVEWEAVSIGAGSQPMVLPVADAGVLPPLEGPHVAAVPRVETGRATEQVPAALLAAILTRLEMTAPSADGMPPWLADAVGDPRTYDSATTSRKDVCARVDPGLYRRLQAMKEGEVRAADNRGGLGVRVAGGAGGGGA